MNIKITSNLKRRIVIIKIESSESRNIPEIDLLTSSIEEICHQFAKLNMVNSFVVKEDFVNKILELRIDSLTESSFTMIRNEIKKTVRFAKKNPMIEKKMGFPKGYK